MLSKSKNIVLVNAVARKASGKFFFFRLFFPSCVSPPKEFKIQNSKRIAVSSVPADSCLGMYFAKGFKDGA